MARKISGIITTTQDQPLAGARVTAWDRDTFSSDDFMGQSITNSTGEYSISYAGGHWDLAPHEVTTWRPDIYITVDVPHNESWIKLYESGIRSNQRLREDLTINAVVSLPNPNARTVFGVVRWRTNGESVSGAKVMARDVDIGLIGAEFMGEALTGADGKYRIPYAGGHWDTAPHFTTKWRPDIFIEVHIKNAVGRWKEVWSSEIYHNHRLAEPLEINPFVDPPPKPLANEAPPPQPARGAGGTTARFWNRSGETRYLYVNSELLAPLFNNETTDLSVACGQRAQVDAKDRMSDVLNDVTFSALVPGFCETARRQLQFEIWQ